MSNIQKYWFSDKRYGWGWGLPSAWQGWVVLVGYVLFLPQFHSSTSGTTLRLFFSTRLCYQFFFFSSATLPENHRAGGGAGVMAEVVCMLNGHRSYA